MRPILLFIAAMSLGCNGNPLSSADREYGRVWLTSATAQTPPEFSAQFGGSAPVNQEANRKFGDCYVTGAAPNTFSSAGTLELTGIADSWQLQPDPTTTGYHATRSGDGWAAGASLTVSASGEVVPAFTNTVVAPGDFVLLDDKAELLAAVDGDSDLTLDWQPIAASGIWAGVRSGDQGISCSWDGSAGHGLIPGAALATLPAAGRTLSSVANNSSAIERGSWWINVIAQSRAQFADGSGI
jgi:hypothetical protein